MNIFDPDDFYNPYDDYIEQYTYTCEEIDRNKYVHEDKFTSCNLESKNHDSLTVQISYSIKISGNRRSNGKRTTQKNTKKEKIKKFGKYGGG